MPRGFKFLVLILTIAISITLISAQSHANKMQSAGYQLEKQPASADWEITQIGTSSASPGKAIPPAEQDECLHCHITGSNESLWTPLARWMTFGVVGMVAAFGVTRSAWVWKNRKPWVPVTTRAGDWIDERYHTKEALEKALKKPVPNWATRWWYCLGGITAFLFVIQAITGIMLAFYYQPTPEQAYASIQHIETTVFFGASIRAIHHWAANGMIVMCIAHMFRVFIMGAFKPPRELNWSSGVILLIVTLAFGFTGYLLPWDQRAYWATTVGTEIAGGIPDIGELILVFLRVGWGITAATLSRFYALHVIVLPIMVILMMGLHFLMIRRMGLKEPL
ncbi:cytochrome b N-terminal domain-containing protein [bacterium]|nr:cytochrome b N-terminal domain-containing protein [bacterium]